MDQMDGGDDPECCRQDEGRPRGSQDLDSAKRDRSHGIGPVERSVTTQKIGEENPHISEIGKKRDSQHEVVAIARVIALSVFLPIPLTLPNCFSLTVHCRGKPSKASMIASACFGPMPSIA